MNKHVRARTIVDSNKFTQLTSHSFMREYINECEATEKKYEELQRDIIFISLLRNPYEREIAFDELVEKVGVGNE